MNDDLVLLDKQDRIAYVTLNRPEKLNALTPEGRCCGLRSGRAGTEAGPPQWKDLSVRAWRPGRDRRISGWRAVLRGGGATTASKVLLRDQPKFSKEHQSCAQVARKPNPSSLPED